MMLAARMGLADLVEKTIKMGADVNEKSKRGSNALQMASEAGHLEVTQTGRALFGCHA